MKGKHSSAPWKHVRYNIFDSKGDSIALIGSSDAMIASGATLANANLIAAAPDLLAKLEEIEKVISEWPCQHEGGDYLHGWILNSTRDLITKAKGQS